MQSLVQRTLLPRIIPFILLFPHCLLALSEADCDHLLDRTCLGDRWTHRAAIRPLGRANAVQFLLATLRATPFRPPPAWINESSTAKKGQPPTEAERKKQREKRRIRGEELKRWWLSEIIETPFPFTEFLVLFWHNHFTSSLKKVKSPKLLYFQNFLFRRTLATSFSAMLKTIPRDPAMVLYLDSQSNQKGAPNENFARELLELFTLGEGHYSENDIREAARAFTGMSVNKKMGEFRFRSRRHDGGEKTFMERRGKWRGDDVIEILLKNRRTAQFITLKMWRAFITRDPSTQELKPIADHFFSTDYDLKTLITDLLTHDHFWASDNRLSMIKSPVELLAGAIRPTTPPDRKKFIADPRLIKFLKNCGQDLFDPPNVKGWPGGTRWITASTLLLRRQFIARLRLPEMSTDCPRPTEPAYQLK